MDQQIHFFFLIVEWIIFRPETVPTSVFKIVIESPRTCFKFSNGARLLPTPTTSWYFVYQFFTECTSNTCTCSSYQYPFCNNDSSPRLSICFQWCFDFSNVPPTLFSCWKPYKFSKKSTKYESALSKSRRTFLVFCGDKPESCYLE